MKAPSPRLTPRGSIFLAGRYIGFPYEFTSGNEPCFLFDLILALPSE